VDPRFCRGFWQKRVEKHGVLVVKLWWIDGGMLVFGWWFFGAEKMSLF
jgi:hypothetical protein